LHIHRAVAFENVIAVQNIHIHTFTYIRIPSKTYMYPHIHRAVAFENVIAVQNGLNVFESRETTVENWQDSFIR
jgi:hypothetical protein